MRELHDISKLDLNEGFDLNGFSVRPTLNLIDGPNGEHRVEPKVMAVLVCLTRRAGSLVQHHELIHEVWGSRGATSDLVSRAIGELRRCFGEDPKTGRFIETIRKGGYCLRAMVGPMSAHYVRVPRPTVGPRSNRRWLRSWISPALASGLSFAATAAWSIFVCGI